MARDVRFTATAPIKFDPNLKPGDVPPAPNVFPWPRDEQGNLKTLSICACGISAKFPICDGAHKVCREVEEPGHVHVWDVATRTVIHKQVDDKKA